MASHRGQDYPPPNGRYSEGSNHGSYDEKGRPNSRSSNNSKRFIWRMCRLGATMALTIAVLVLTLIILVAGRHGDGNSDLSLITVSTDGADSGYISSVKYLPEAPC